MSLPLTKQALLAEISQSRAAVIRDFRALRDGVNVAEKLRNSVRTHSPMWLGGATIAGFLLTHLLGGKRINLASLVGMGEEEATSASSSSFLSKSLGLLGRKGGMLLNVSRFFFPIVKSAVASYTTNKICKLVKFPK